MNGTRTDRSAQPDQPGSAFSRSSIRPPPKLVCGASSPPSVRRTAQYLNSGILRERVERRVGQPVDRRLVVAERDEHRAARRAVVGARDTARPRRGATRSSRRRPARRPSRRGRADGSSATGSGSSASSARRAPRHAAGVPVLELAAGDQHHRVLGIGALVGRDDVGRHEPRLGRLRAGTLSMKTTGSPGSPSCVHG